MDAAARQGHLEVVKWLHENRKEGCKKSTMRYTMSLETLEVFKWLHKNRTDGYNEEDLIEEVTTWNYPLEVILYLYKHFPFIRSALQKWPTYEDVLKSIQKDFQTLHTLGILHPRGKDAYGLTWKGAFKMLYQQWKSAAQSEQAIS